MSFGHVLRRKRVICLGVCAIASGALVWRRPAAALDMHSPARPDIKHRSGGHSLIADFLPLLTSRSVRPLKALWRTGRLRLAPAAATAAPHQRGNCDRGSDDALHPYLLDVGDGRSSTRGPRVKIA